ncbi:unnamed protein product [Soboliphyme baturini]|uniref:VIT domain-containing protein n=1 Tax=Soboliphyme baturini TaxID=241478 RepID=A0A183IRA4_9BILA|nr:unnamed protein product [Soboliphyme baturini]
MPVEVTAVLTKRCAVYHSGETVECTISLHNSSDPSNGPVETLAWCSAQILCQEILNSRKVNKIKSSESLSQSDIASHGTSFLPSRGECGSTVYSSKPVILGCDVQLLPGQTKILLYEDNLPLEDVYNVVMDNEKVCRVSLKKKSFRLGEDIPVTLNFEECDVACYEVVE